MKSFFKYTIAIVFVSFLFSCDKNKDEIVQPASIAGLTAEASEESIFLAWDRPNGEIKKYVIVYNPGDGLIDIVDPSETNYLIDKLKSETNYEVSLYWVNNENIRSIASSLDVTTLQKEGIKEYIYEGDLLLPNQAAIDALALKYTSVTGKLRIGNGTDGSDITDVSVLSNIKEVGKNLEIDGNDLLTNLNFLTNLKKVGGNFWLRNNKMLNSISDLMSLNEITSNLYIIGNPNITNLNGLEGLSIVKLINIGIRSGNKSDKGNELLSDFCALKPVLTILPSVSYNCDGNAYNPTKEDILNEKCSK